MRFFQRGAGKAGEVQGQFQSGGVSLAYETAGTGTPVVLVHGFASSLATNWKNPGIMKALAEAGFRCAAFDLRGHGGSGRPTAPGSYSLESMAQDVERFIGFLGLERPHLAGYSMGSRILLRLLTTRPHLARSAILGGIGEGAGQSSDAFTLRIAEALLAPDPRDITDLVARRFRLFAQSQGQDLQALAQCIREALEPVDLSALSRIEVPVLVLAGGEDDQITNPDGLAARIPGAQAQIIPNRNHMTIIGDARFKQAIASFLKSVSQ